MRSSPERQIARSGFVDEAIDFVTHPELPGDRTSRAREVRAEIERSGRYAHTAEELAHGARLAWRNSPRCIGRLHWKSLQVRDRRSCATPEEVAEACFEHLRESTDGGRLTSMVTVFRPADPVAGGPRIWNSQLIRYAGYRRSDGSVVGDPLNLRLTAAIERLGWRGPGGSFDVLPVVVQFPNAPPRWFPVPRDAVLEVPISHPDYSWFADLGLRWHAVPAISDMALEIGGVTYSAAPFSAWYVNTEIAARNFSDANRYNVLPVVAERMGLDTTTDRSLWRDRALVEVNQAVLHSFRAASVRMVDHHAASRQFVAYERLEARAGRSVNADWAWVVPPLSPSVLATYHRSYAPPDFDVRPNFCRQPEPHPIAQVSEPAEASAEVVAATGCPVAAL